jgi:hypothetical protein
LFECTFSIINIQPSLMLLITVASFLFWELSILKLLFCPQVSLIIKFSNSPASSCHNKDCPEAIFPSGLVLLIPTFLKNLSQLLPINYKRHNQLNIHFICGVLCDHRYTVPFNKAAFSFKKGLYRWRKVWIPIKLKLDAGPRSTVFSPLLESLWN